MKKMKVPKGWKLDGKTLVRKIKFSNFMEGLYFVQNVAQHAEKMKHHPDVLLKYGEVVFFLRTHEKGDVTEKDTELAEKINEVLGK